MADTATSSAEKSALQTVMGWVGDLLGDAGDLLTGEDTRRALIGDLGGKAGARTSPLQFPPAALGSINAYRDAAEPTLEGLAAALADAHTAFETIRSFVQTLEIDDASVIADEVYRDLIDLLATNFVRQRWPRLYFALQAAGYEEEFTSTNGGGYNVIHEILVDGNFLYETDSRTPTIKVINISNPAAPTFVRNIVTSDLLFIHAVHIAGGRLLLRAGAIGAISMSLQVRLKSGTSRMSPSKLL